MKKWILRGVLALVILLVLGLVTVYFMRNSLVRWGVVRGGKTATEQETALSIADLSLGGSLNLNGLDINNLSGYTAPKILVMKSCGVVVKPSSLFSHTVQVDKHCD